jgi:hypothetical protein
MWMRKLRNTSQTSWAKPTTSATRLVRRRSTRTLRNTPVGMRGILAVAAAAKPEKIYRCSSKNLALFLSLFLILSLS